MLIPQFRIPQNTTSQIYRMPTHAIYFYMHKVFCCARISNRWSVSVIYKFGRLTMAYYNRYKTIWAVSNISATHAFDYIVLRVKFGLTSCEELAMPLYKGTNTSIRHIMYINYSDKYSRTSIIRTPVCHSNVKGVQINEFVWISELSDKIHYLAS